MKHWLLAPNVYPVHFQSQIHNCQKLIHNKAGNHRPCNVLAETWEPVTGPPLLQLFFWGRLSSPLQVPSHQYVTVLRCMTCVMHWHKEVSLQGRGYFLLTHKVLEGQDSIWEHSFSRIRVTVVLLRELNKQPLMIKKMMVYFSEKKRGGDCSWRGYRIVATLRQMWKSKENWYVKSVCFGLWVQRKEGNASACGPSQGRQRASDTLNLWVTSLPPYWAQRC